MIFFKDLGKTFDREWVFRNLSLSVQPRESVVLMGPSGSGKTLLLKILAGLLKADEGEILLNTKNIGMLFQKNALFDSFTVEENLLFPLREAKGIIGHPAQERMRLFLQAVGLSGYEKLYPEEISGGMQKRLGMARALIIEPELVFYDEPTAGLDPITSRSIANLILHLKRETGSTLLMVTNDIKRAYQLGDRIFLLAQGQLTAGGTAQEIRSSKNPALRQFIYGLKEGPLTSGLD